MNQFESYMPNFIISKNPTWKLYYPYFLHTKHHELFLTPPYGYFIIKYPLPYTLCGNKAGYPKKPAKQVTLINLSNQ